MPRAGRPAAADPGAGPGSITASAREAPSAPDLDPLILANPTCMVPSSSRPRGHRVPHARREGPAGAPRADSVFRSRLHDEIAGHLQVQRRAELDAVEGEHTLLVGH